MMGIQHKNIHYINLKLARHITECIWLQLTPPPKFLATLGTSDTLKPLDEVVDLFMLTKGMQWLVKR
jgi:hypothetical protein